MIYDKRVYIAVDDFLIKKNRLNNSNIIIFSVQSFADVRHRGLFVHFAHSPIDGVHYGHPFSVLPAVRRQKLPN